MKSAYVFDFNNILLDIKNRVNLANDPRNADVLIIWQDVRGAMKTLCDINNDYLKKPVVVVQHGRGATRDYLEPNNFKMVADRMCVWGQTEFDRMKKAGYGDRAIITGSPLVKYTRTRMEREQKAKNAKVIVYTPIISDKEQAFNIEVALELRKIEYTYVQEKLRACAKDLKKGWHSWMVDQTCATENQVPYELLHKEWYPIHKITDIHDKKLYHGEHVLTTVTHSKHLETSKILLNNCDCVLGIEEGTFQLMATAMGIPTVIVDGFKYETYGGVSNYDRMEVIRTNATAFCELKDLRQTIENEMNNPDKRKNAREEVTKNEFDPFPDKDPIELIIDVASELAGADVRHQANLVEV